MATVGNAFKINAAVSNSRSTTGTLYTAPAASWAKLNLFVNRSGSGTIQGTVTVGGTLVWSSTSTVAFLGNDLTPIEVGPSQVVSCTITGGITGIGVSGVEFTNS